MSPPRNSRSPQFNSRSKISSAHTLPSTPSPASSRHRHSQSLQSVHSVHSLPSIQSHPLTTPRKPPRPLLERLLSPLALSPMSSPLHSPLPTLTFESQQLQTSLPASPHKESRSERLLREALIKDDLALSQSATPMAAHEPTLMLLGLPSPPLTRPTHRRRHSHVPVASRTATGADVSTKTGYAYGYGAEGNGYGERRSDQKRVGRASELRDRGHDGEVRQQGYEQPLSSSPSSSSIASSSLYPHSQHSYTTHQHQQSHSHSHSLSTPHSPKLFYGGDAEMMYPSPAPSFLPYSAFSRRTEPTLPPSEVRPHRGYSTPDVRRNISTDPRRVGSSPNPRRGDFSRAESPSPSPHTRHTPLHQGSTSTSTSPSPYPRQQQAPKASSPPYRPRSPALYQSATRPHSPSPSRMHSQTPTQGQTQRSQKRQSLPANIHSTLPTTPSASNQVHVTQTTPGIPLPMTPHEKALRARLERVLYGNGGATVSGPDNGKMRRENEAKLGRRERCGSNEVRDETGGWPWRERERDMISTPPTSASSSGSGSHSPNSPLSQPSQLSQEQHANKHSLSSSSASIAQPRPQRQTSPSFARNASPTLHRARGSSESQKNQTPNHTSSSNTTPNRNRSTTSPFQSRIPQPAVYKSQPVTPRTPARGQMQQQQQQQDSIRGQSRTPRSPAQMPLHLPTTPRREIATTAAGPTTPRTPRTPALAPPRTPKMGAGSTTPRTPRTAAKGTDVARNAELKAESGTENKEAHSGAESGEQKSGGVLTPPPTPPVRARIPESSPGPFRLQTGLGMGRPKGRGRSTSAEGSEEDGGVDDVGAGTGTDTDAGSESDAAGEHGEVGQLDSPTKMKPRRPFNARKASERLRGTEGYVSFASVEGLGEPPDTPVCETEGEVRGRRGFGLGVLAGWWGGRANGEVA